MSCLSKFVITTAEAARNSQSLSIMIFSRVMQMTSQKNLWN